MPEESTSGSGLFGLIGRAWDWVFESRITVRIIGLAGAALILAGFTPLALQARLLAEASDWPSVQGRVHSAEVTSEHRRRRGGRGSSGSRYRLHYLARVQYRYAIGTTTYVNDDIWVTDGGSFRTYEEAAAVVGAYRPGGPVQVFYAPDDPHRSALRIEGRLGPRWDLIVIGSIFLGTVLLVLVAARRPATQAGAPPQS